MSLLSSDASRASFLMPGPFKDAFFGLCSTLYVGDCYGSILNLLHGLHIALASHSLSLSAASMCSNLSTPMSKLVLLFGFEPPCLILYLPHTPQIINTAPECTFSPPTSAPAPSFSDSWWHQCLVAPVLPSHPS